MNGLTIVPTTQSFIRISRIVGLDVGSAESNVGTITATSASSASLQSQMDIDLGQSSAAIGTIPNSSFGLITSFQAAATGTDSGIVDFQTREPGRTWRVRQRVTVPSGASTNVRYMRFQSPLLIAPGSDFKIRAIKDGGGGTASVSASINYYLIDKREVDEDRFKA